MDLYNSVFTERYCRGSILLKTFSGRNKVETWRQLWIWLAEAQLELGIRQINQEMIDEMILQKKQVDDKKLIEAEKELKHDVMANIKVFSQLCPKASTIIHLGATSCFVQDNADLINQRFSLIVIMKRLTICLGSLNDFAKKHSNFPTLGRTHYQAASLVTLGKRACIWAQELLMALKMTNFALNEMKFRGIKGATGTQDTFLTLFDGNEESVKKLDDLITQKAGFKQHFDICGQTYPRQQDSLILFCLSNIGSAAKRIAQDIRILQGWDEIREPFEDKQVGSSAMPHKRNPIRCERICGLGRVLMKAVQDGLETCAEQGLEHTLDDSSNRRIVIPQSFLCAEALLITLQNVLNGITVRESVIQQNVFKELPLVSLEKALILMTQQGISRQDAHSSLREAALSVYAKQEDGRSETVDYADMFKAKIFNLVRDELVELFKDPLNFCGRCVSQTELFFANEVGPCLEEVEKLFVGYDNLPYSDNLEV